MDGDGVGRKEGRKKEREEGKKEINKEDIYLNAAIPPEYMRCSADINRSDAPRTKRNDANTSTTTASQLQSATTNTIRYPRLPDLVLLFSNIFEAWWVGAGDGLIVS